MSFSAHQSPLSKRVEHIIFACPNEQMLRVRAASCIASVAYIQSVRNNAKMQGVRVPMRQNVFAATAPHLSVTVWLLISGPYPTLVRVVPFYNLSEKFFIKCFSHRYPFRGSFQAPREQHAARIGRQTRLDAPPLSVPASSPCYSYGNCIASFCLRISWGYLITSCSVCQHKLPSVPKGHIAWTCAFLDDCKFGAGRQFKP